MATDDFFRARLDAMIELKHPLAVLSTRLPWPAIEAAVAPKLSRRALPAKQVRGKDLLGAYDAEFGGGVSPAGRPRLPIRLMASLLYLKNSFNLSDEEPCAGPRTCSGSSSVAWIITSRACRAAPPRSGDSGACWARTASSSCSRPPSNVPCRSRRCCPPIWSAEIVDSTVQSKAIAHPVDSRLLEIARHKVVSAAKRAGIRCKQTYAQEGKTLRRQAGGYAHAKQFKRLRKTVKRQRTILGVVMREVQRKLDADKAAVAAGGAPAHESGSAKAISDLTLWLERAERIRTQQRNTKNKLYALYAPEVECISKGKARKPCEFGVKVSLAVTHKQGLMVGAHSFPGNPYDGHVLSAQLEQTANLASKTWGARPGRTSSTWATGAWTPTTRACRSSTGASTSRSAITRIACSSAGKPSSR